MFCQEHANPIDLARGIHVSGAERLPDAAGGDGFAYYGVWCHALEYFPLFGSPLWLFRPPAEVWSWCHLKNEATSRNHIGLPEARNGERSAIQLGRLNILIHVRYVIGTNCKDVGPFTRQLDRHFREEQTSYLIGSACEIYLEVSKRTGYIPSLQIPIIVHAA